MYGYMVLLYTDRSKKFMRPMGFSQLLFFVPFYLIYFLYFWIRKVLSSRTGILHVCGQPAFQFLINLNETVFVDFS